MGGFSQYSRERPQYSSYNTAGSTSSFSVPDHQLGVEAASYMDRVSLYNSERPQLSSYNMGGSMASFGAPPTHPSDSDAASYWSALSAPTQPSMGGAANLSSVAPSRRSGASGASERRGWGIFSRGRRSSAASGLPGPSRSSELTRQQQQLVGVARWPDPRYNNEDARTQQSYGQSFWKATRKAGSRISSGKISSLNELWSHASDWRSQAAGSSSMTFRSNRRDPESNLSRITGLDDRYGYIKDRYADRTDGNIERLPYGLAPQMRFQAHDEIDGESISLTSIVMSTNSNADRTDEMYSRFRANSLVQLGEPFHIDHTDAANVPRIMEHAESLYSHALRPDIDNSQALSTMGELHWWLAHAMPDERGSAAKSEFSVRSIAQARGMDLPPFQHGILPDLEAMTTARSDFVENYPRMLGL